MDLSLLKNAGLANGEIKIYETLMDNGGLFAGRIIELSGLKRGDCYNKIYDLVQKGLVLESTKNKKKYFELAEPEAIETYIDNQLENYTATQKEIRAVLPDIISSYNLAYHKPGVKFFEGEEAIEKITRDALLSKSEILSFVDIEAVTKYAQNINKKFVAARRRLKKKKRVVVADTALNRQYFTKAADKLTIARFINAKLENFNINMQIYDDKISYITVLKDRTIGIIIEDKHIAKINKQIFEYVWSTGKN